MKTDTRFKWGVPDSGFEWGTLKGDRQLRWRSESTAGWVERRVPPIGLFRKFAALGLSAVRDESIRERKDMVAIQAFANRYGDILIEPGRGAERKTDAIGNPPGIKRRFATLNQWRNEIRRMRGAVSLWDRRNANEDAVRLEVREGLYWITDKALINGTTPSHALAHLDQNLKLFVQPMNLLAFMWFTLARLVAGEIEERPCEMFDICGNYVYVGSGWGLQRGDTTTCGETCRKRKNRQRAPPR